MLKTHIPRRRLALAALGTVVVPRLATAQERFPSRPNCSVVGYPAGGASDVVARILAAGVARQLGQPVIVDNRPGAVTALAAEHVAKSTPDGYTVMTVDMRTMVYDRRCIGGCLKIRSATFR